ncbi:MAG: FAD:protein FMN transferase [Gemmataceae bacterium]|nr:FAD:protein FMN transferase [Gemmataceae bacterium]
MLKNVALSLLILPAGLLGVNAWQPRELTRYTFAEPHMGTTFRIVLYAPDEATAKKAAKAAFARIAELNAILSDYQPTSELMQLCGKAGGPPVAVSVDLFEVLKKSEEFARLTDGAFDVSISPVVRLWRKARRTREMPSAEDIKKVLDLVDYRKIKLDAKGRTVQLLLMGMLLDLGGIAKGYAADAAVTVLRQHGITRTLVAAGGDVAVGDAPPDAPGWKVGIAPLKNSDATPEHYLMLKNAGVSTAGDSEQFVEINGKRYSHIVDTNTGVGLVGRRSVTVIAPNAFTSDGLDTGLCILGVERGMKIVEAKDDIAALFVFETAKGIETTASKRFAKYLWKDGNASTKHTK